jgi:thymidylate kinase
LCQQAWTKLQEETMMHIAIEGMDGVGKTTAAKTVAAALDFTFVEKPLHYIFDDDGSADNYVRIRNYFNEQPDRFLSAWFYGLGNLYIYERFKGCNIVTDRHLLSNYCWSGTEENIEIYDLLVKRIGAPDYTFILYADAETAVTRIHGRDATGKDVKKTVFIPEAYRKMEDFCNRYDMPYVMIDTRDKTAERVATQIIETVKRIEQ